MNHIFLFDLYSPRSGESFGTCVSYTCGDEKFFRRRERRVEIQFRIRRHALSVSVRSEMLSP